MNYSNYVQYLLCSIDLVSVGSTLLFSTFSVWGLISPKLRIAFVDLYMQLELISNTKVRIPAWLSV